MLARFATRDDPDQLLRSAWLLPAAPPVDLSRDGGRSWDTGYDLAAFVERHPEAVTAPRQSVRRSAGNVVQWIVMLPDPQRK